MSKAQPTPRQSFVQTLLLMAVIFLGMRLMCPPPEPEKREPQVILQEVRKHHEEYAKTGSSEALNALNSESSKLQQRLSQENEGEKLTAEEKDRMLREAQVLAADTTLKHSVKTNNFTELQMAYQTIHESAPEIRNQPIWNQPFKVAPTEAFPRTQVTLAQLYSDMEKHARDIGQTALVWGMVPGYAFIDFLINLTGAVPWFSYAFAAFLLALVVRGAVWPLAQKQYMFSRQMMQLSPLIKELKEKYEGQELQVKTMELYQQYGINPMAGCGPALLQMPLFFLVYQCMLLYRFEFTNGTFLWISPEGHAAAPALIAPNLGERDYILLVFYGISMITTQFLTPISDPANARQQRIMGIGITVLFTVVMFTPIFPVPSAFVLYWIFTNVIATIQMIRAYRLPLPPLAKVNTPQGGKFARMMQQAQEAKMAQEKGKGDTSTPGNGAFKGTGAPKLHKPKKKKK